MTVERDMEAVQRIEVVPSILEIACRLTGMGFATVARVTPKRWVACVVRDEAGFGLPAGGELQIENTFCDTVRTNREPVVMDAASLDPVYASNPIPVAFGFESYISVPIILADGQVFGTLCALGRAPARVRNPETMGAFAMFARLIATHIDDMARMEAAEAHLAEERTEAAERERFIAILGHDLRNPLAAMAAGTRLLRAAEDEQQAQRIAEHMFATVARMGGLVDNVLDFARARMAGGIGVHPQPTQALEQALRNVVGEMQVVAPDRAIDARYALDTPVRADVPRIAQLFANLLGNALHHGSEEAPVRVDARSGPDGLALAVANAGPPIPDDVRGRMFRPFSRGEVRPGQEGLGLGLYIASEIARAHGGAIELVSDMTGTCFTLRLPA